MIGNRTPESVAVALAVAATLVAGCGESKKPKVDAATERAQATERAKQRDFGGAEVKALEDSKKMGDDLNRKAQERVDDAEKTAK